MSQPPSEKTEQTEQDRSASKSTDSHTITEAVALQQADGFPNSMPKPSPASVRGQENWAQQQKIGDQGNVKAEELGNHAHIKSEQPLAQPTGPSGATTTSLTGSLPAGPQALQPQERVNTNPGQAQHLAHPSQPHILAGSSGTPGHGTGNPPLPGQNIIRQGSLHASGSTSLNAPGSGLPNGQLNNSYVQQRPAPLNTSQAPANPLQRNPSASGAVGQAGALPQTVHPTTALTPQEALKAGKQVSIGDIQRVQNYIEKCLQLYLSQKEVVQQLDQQCQIEPCFTQLVWQKLEEQNQEFFRAYYTRLKLKDQIVLFNHLLDEQVKMFQRMPPRNGPAGGGAALMQPVAGLPNHNFPQQRLGLPAQAATSQPPPASQPILQPPGTSYPMAPATLQVSQQPPGSQAEQAVSHEFPELGLEGGISELPGDLASGGTPGLQYSESDLNLAGMAGLGKGFMGGHDHDLAGIPRNFSLTDLGLDNDHSELPRNISLSDFPALDLDSGGEQN